MAISKKMLAIVAILLIVVVAIAAALSGGDTAAKDDGDKSDTLPDNTAANSKLAMSVSNIKAHHPTESIRQAADGNILIYVYGNITNKGIWSMFVSSLDFSLIGSDGIAYTYTVKLDSFTSASLAKGKSMAYYCGFEIPSGVTPKTIKFENGDSSISVNVKDSIIDLTYPQYVEISGISYETVESGNPYLVPDPGNRFVQVSMTLQSKMPKSLDLNPLYFTLETSDGLSHDYSYAITPVIPDGIQPGASTIIKVTFEISESAEPTKLIYDDHVNYLTMEISSA